MVATFLLPSEINWKERESFIQENCRLRENFVSRKVNSNEKMILKFLVQFKSYEYNQSFDLDPAIITGL